MKKAKHILLLFLIICMSVFMLSSCDGLDMEKVNEILAGLKGGAGNPDCAHTGAEWVVKNEASCTADGEKILVCPDYSAIVSTESIPALGHDEASHEAKPACTGTGWDAYVTCSRCDYTTYVEKAATGHNFENKVCIWCGDEKASEGLNFTSNGDGTCSVSGIGTCTDTDIIIPEVSPDGDRVTSIGEYAFYGCDSLASVTLGNSVTNIGDWAFSWCKSLTSVTIGNSVTSIGDYAFYGCDSLTSIIIPDSVKSIGDDVFSYCHSLTSVTIGNSVTSIGDEAFSYCTSLTSINVSENNENYKSIDGDLYSKDGSTLIQYAIGKTDTLFTIPNSVTNIGDWAFSWCKSLTSVTIPDSVESIGDWAFYSCNSLTSVTIGNSVTSIGDYAFDGCDSLTSITIPDSVTSIGKDAFSSCSGLTNITLGNSVTSIGECAFHYCNSLTSINVSENNENYKSIDGNLYSKDGSTLIQYAIGKTDTLFTIPNSVTSIGEGAFYGCRSLTSITIPDSVESIGDYAFYGCDSLTSVTIGNSVTSIGDEAFYYCTSLTSVTIGNSVTSIGDYAFYYCTSLASVTIGNSVTNIGDWAFDCCDSLASINVSENNENYKSIDGNLYSKDGSTLIQYAIGKTDKLFEIPNSVTSIGDEAFYYCTSLTSVTIGNSVTSIGDYAFYYCTSLASVTIGNSVTNIGDWAFDCCFSLTTVYYGGREEDWSKISIGSSNTYLTDAARYYYSESEPTEAGNFWHYDENGNIEIW